MRIAHSFLSNKPLASPLVIQRYGGVGCLGEKMQTVGWRITQNEEHDWAPVQELIHVRSFYVPPCRLFSLERISGVPRENIGDGFTTNKRIKQSTQVYSMEKFFLLPPSENVFRGVLKAQHFSTPHIYRGAKPYFMFLNNALTPCKSRTKPGRPCPPCWILTVMQRDTCSTIHLFGDIPLPFGTRGMLRLAVVGQ